MTGAPTENSGFRDAFGAKRGLGAGQRELQDAPARALEEHRQRILTQLNRFPTAHGRPTGNGRFITLGYLNEIGSPGTVARTGSAETLDSALARSSPLAAPASFSTARSYLPFALIDTHAPESSCVRRLSLDGSRARVLLSDKSSAVGTIPAAWEPWKTIRQNALLHDELEDRAEARHKL